MELGFCQHHSVFCQREPTTADDGFFDPDKWGPALLTSLGLLQRENKSRGEKPAAASRGRSSLLLTANANVVGPAAAAVLGEKHPPSSVTLQRLFRTIFVSTRECLGGSNRRTNKLWRKLFYLLIIPIHCQDHLSLHQSKA